MVAAAMGQPGQDAGDVLDAFIRGLGMPRSLHEVKIGPEHFDRIAKQAMGTPWVPRNPPPDPGPGAGEGNPRTRRIEFREEIEKSSQGVDYAPLFVTERSHSSSGWGMIGPSLQEAG